MKIKKHEKLNLINYNWLTDAEKKKKVDFITSKLNYLLLNNTLYLSNTNIFINYSLDRNTFNIHIGNNIFYTSTIQNIIHYIEKEYIKQGAQNENNIQ